MKGKVLAAALIAGGVISPLAHATNGDAMMSVGSQNTALGGTGVANFTGAESTFANPAMLGKSKGTEVTGGVTLFKPDVTNTGMFPGGTGTAQTSSANTNYIPDLSFSSRINDSLTYGVAMAGIAGMGVDYSGAPAASFAMAKTSMSILKVVPTIAYNTNDYGLGFSPVLQYGTLAISYNAGAPVNPNSSSSSSTGYGFALGGYYNVNPDVTVAAAYNSAIDMTYGTQLSTAGKGFGQTFGDKLTQPAEIKAGVAYSFAKSYTLTADFKQIQWGNSTGYKEFGWKNQNVIAIGGKYAGDGYWLGLGYNKADNPINPFPIGAPTPAGNTPGTVNLFNNLMFPAIVKNSYTLGGGYSIAKNFDIDAAAVFSPKVTATVDITGAGGLPPGSMNTTTHSQQSYSVSLRYKF